MFIVMIQVFFNVYYRDSGILQCLLLWFRYSPMFIVMIQVFLNVYYRDSSIRKCLLPSFRCFLMFITVIQVFFHFVLRWSLAAYRTLKSNYFYHFYNRYGSLNKMGATHLPPAFLLEHDLISHAKRYFLRQWISHAIITAKYLPWFTEICGLQDDIFKHRVSCDFEVWIGLLPVIWWPVFRHNMTYTVDWEWNIKNQSLFVSLAFLFFR